MAITPSARLLLRRLAGPAADRARKLVARSGERSWSQEGEDRVLLRYFSGQRSGFYVDVGAHHPHRFSNTALLHRLGWRGINIDAMPGSMQPFRRHRPNDINLEIGIAEIPGGAKFHIFDETALNTFDAEIAARHAATQYKLERVVEVPLLTLRDVFAQHLPPGVAIDLMTVDAEGRDLGVLRSNDWERHRPRLVLAESVGKTIADLPDDPCAQFMQAVGYVAYAKTINTVFYADRRRMTGGKPS